MKVYSIVMLTVLFGLIITYNAFAQGIETGSIELNVDSSFNYSGLSSRGIDLVCYEQNINASANNYLSANPIFQNYNHNVDKPPLIFGKLFSQALIGALGTWIGGLPPFFALQDVNRAVKGDAGYSSVANIGFTIGSILGNSLGVYLIGNRGDTEGSYLITILGTTIASMPSFLLTNDPYAVYYGLTLGAVIQDVGSIIGFNRSRRYRFIDRHTSFDIPRDYTSVISKHRRIIQGVELVKVQF